MSSVPESISIAATESRTPAKNAVLAIVVGAFVGGAVSIVWVCMSDGWDIPIYIAARLVGRQALQGGAGMWTLGMALHFFIACVWGTVYYLASRKLPFLTDHPFLGGVNFGAWIQLFMLLVVLPLARLHHTDAVTIEGVVTKIVTFGLPVAYSVRYFAPARAAQRGSSGLTPQE
jgi:hypothetical protein